MRLKSFLHLSLAVTLCLCLANAEVLAKPALGQDLLELMYLVKGKASRGLENVKSPKTYTHAAALTELRDVDETIELKTTTESIRKRIEAMAKHHFVDWSLAADVKYPPSFVLLKVYKEEAELEIWAGANASSLKRIAEFPVCAMDFTPGPKLKEGDGRTPEGRYALDFYGYSKNWFMWMDLSPKNIDRRGRVGTGSAFRFCTDYPRDIDKARSKSIDIQTPGSGICIHGNCCSSGCPSLKNRDFAAVFAFVSHHNTEIYGKPMVEIYPFRINKSVDLDAKAQKAATHDANSQKLGAARIKADWEALFKPKD